MKTSISSNSHDHASLSMAKSLIFWVKHHKLGVSQPIKKGKVILIATKERASFRGKMRLLIFCSAVENLKK
ncbi:hypothetical protein [Vibrio owensii]